MAIRDVIQVRAYQSLDDIEVLANCQWTYLLVVSDHDDLLS
jgi:hypothetical protein